MSARFVRAAVAVAVVVSVLGGGLFLPRAAGAAEGFSFDRLAGDTRYHTARAIAVDAFPEGADEAILATGATYADALAASFLAGNRSGPVLLTTRDFLHAAAKSALATLQTRRVTIVGGTAAVSKAVEDELRGTASSADGAGDLQVTRIGGIDRYRSARMLATASGTAVGSIDGARTAVVARGDGFADALAGAALAYAGKLPVLTTRGGSSPLHADAKAALQQLEIDHVLVLGGSAAISSSTEQQIRDARGSGSITTTRLAGNDRTETARRIAEFAVAELGFGTSHVNLARGDDFADALTGGVHAGEERTPVLLTASPRRLAAASTWGAARYLKASEPTLEGGHIFGGTAAVSRAVEAEAELIAEGSDETRPRIVSAAANTAAHIVTVNYSEAVSCVDSAATRSQFTFAGASSRTPTAVSCDRSDTVTLRFRDLTGDGDLTYTDDGAALEESDVADLAGNQAESPQTVTTARSGDTTAPKMLSAVSNGSAKTIAVTYSEPVRCTDSSAARSQFTYRSATPTAVSCPGSSRVFLAFADVTPGSTLRYDDDDETAAENEDVADLAGNPARSPQTVSVTATPDTTAPAMQSAVANVKTDTVTVTYTEAVVCTNDLATRLQFEYAAASPNRPMSITCSGSTATLQFQDVTGGGTLRYDDRDSASADANDVRDQAGNPAKSPDQVTSAVTGDETRPRMTSAAASTDTNQVVVRYAEEIVCTDSSALRSQFTYQGAEPRQPATVTCNGTDQVVLSFTRVTGGGHLLYTDNDPTTSTTDIRDRAGNSAVSPDQVQAATGTTERPQMVDPATSDTADNTITVTYNREVTCTDSQATRARFSYDGAETATPTAVSCGAAPALQLVLTFDTIDNASGTLTYTDESAAGDDNDVRDSQGRQAKSPDRVEVIHEEDENGPPVMTSASVDREARQVVVTYSEPVTCTPSSASQFSFEGAEPSRPISSSCSGHDATLTFTTITDTGTITYDDDDPDDRDGNDVTGDYGRPAKSPDEVTAEGDVTRPFMLSAVADSVSNTVTITYNEEVGCEDGGIFSPWNFFAYTGASGPPTGISCNTFSSTNPQPVFSEQVTLTFTDVTSDTGTVTYADESPTGPAPGNSGDQNDVFDEAGNQAASPDSVTASPPSSVSTSG